MPTEQPELFPVGPSAGYAGWLRYPHAWWWQACTSDTLSACWDALLAIPGRSGVERIVLPVGVHPEEKKKS